MEAGKLKFIVTAHGFTPDDGCVTHLLEACATTGLPISYALALVEKESGFKNVFGHDPVRNPVKGGRVTRLRYAKYKLYRKRGWGMQGVGYTQLTYFGYQDDADRAGGCWKAYPNMVVGFRLLSHLCKSYGKRNGAAHYNGTGPAADAYGHDFVLKQELWHKRIS